MLSHFLWYRFVARTSSVLVFAFFLVACSVHERVVYEDAEGPLPEDLIKAIKKQKPEKSWVLAHLGEPYSVDRINASPNRVPHLYEVYTYRFSKRHIRQGQLMLVLRSGGSQETTEYLHVAFDNHQTQKVWVDEFPRVSIGVRTREMKKVWSEEKTAKVIVEPPRKKQLTKKNTLNWKVPILRKWFSNEPEVPETTEQMPEAKADMEQEEGMPMDKKDMEQEEAKVETMDKADVEMEEKSEEDVPPQS